MEKFVNIKCRSSGLVPNAVVLVATIRALKMHGGGPEVTPGKPLPEVYLNENLDILRKGCSNLARHIENAKKVGIKVIVAVNRFTSDTDAEIQLVKEEALAAGADAAVPCNHWAEGGRGALELGQAVIEACEQPNPFKFLYDLDLPIKAKIETIAKEFYGAASVEYSETAEEQIKSFEAQGFGGLPICMSKTHLSFSADPKLKGAPSGTSSLFYTSRVDEANADDGPPSRRLCHPHPRGPCQHRRRVHLPPIWRDVDHAVSLSWRARNGSAPY